MLQADAEARIKMMTQWDQEPALLQTEIDVLVADYKILYRSPDTWDLNAAAAAGWRLKAGKVAGRYNMSTDVNSLSRGQIYDHCIMQAKQYDKGSTLTVDLSRGQAYDPVLGNVDYANDQNDMATE